MKIKIWPKDATGVVEKFAYVMALVFAPALYLFLLLSAFGVFHNDYSHVCHLAGWGWKVLGVILTLGFIFLIVGDAEDWFAFSPSGWLLFLIAGVSLLSFAGFFV